MSKRDASAKKGGDLLRSGATMLAQSCPDCMVPLFKLTSGEVICPSCDRHVIIVKSIEAEKAAKESTTRTQLEEDLQRKIGQIKTKMADADNPDELEKLAKTLSSLLDLLEKVRRTKV